MRIHRARGRPGRKSLKSGDAMLRWAIVIIATFGTARSWAGDGDAPASDFALSASERRTAIIEAEKTIKSAGLWKGKILLTGAEVLRDRRGGAVRRMALLSHYRYEGDVTLLTRIDLAKGTALGVEEVPHMPTSLAPEELAAAEKLARADPAVAKILAREKEPVEVDALMHYTADEKATTYHHRVVRLFFRQGRTYLLYGPIVEVDLTVEKVRVEVPKGAHN